MSEIKKLAGQTMWYGLSSVAARMLNYLLTPILTYLMSDAKGVAEYGDYSTMYAFIAFMNVVFTYGFETGYFRFSNKDGVQQDTLFQTTFGSLLLSSLLLCFAFGIFYKDVNNFLGFLDHPEYIFWTLAIIALDAINVVPFAKLRQNNQPRRYALIKISGIVINILCVLCFLALLPSYYSQHPQAWGAEWYAKQNRMGLLLLANVVMNAFTFLMLFPQWKSYRFQFDKQLWHKVFLYSSPMILIGMAGMVNEVVDRILLQKLLPLSPMEAKMEVGIYSANYKLAIFITLFIQAFKLAAEPFFFKKALDKNAPQTYAKVMKWFVFTMCLAFLFTMLFLDLWKYFINENYRSGLSLVAILLFANICLGIYYNLSVWYKVTDKMKAGIYITLAGATITILGNYLFIPQYGMYAAAWTTLAAYGSMVIISYFAGQKYFPVPYPLSDISKLLLLMLLLYAIHFVVVYYIKASFNGIPELFLNLGLGFVFFVGYALIVLKWFKSDLPNIPFLKRL